MSATVDTDSGWDAVETRTVGARLLAIGVCLAHDRFVAADSITGGGPLGPFT